jgi:peptidyl-prolyl cis-trans isomerase D
MRSSAKYIWIFLVIFFVGGFLLAETSGLLGRAPVTTSTGVASVNGEDILAVSWFNATQALEQQATQQSGRSLSLDDRQRLKDQAFDELVEPARFGTEYKRPRNEVTQEEN